MKELITLAQDMALPTSPVAQYTIGGAIIAGIASVAGWLRSELSDCKADRKALYAQINDINANVAVLNFRLGQAEQHINKSGGH